MTVSDRLTLAFHHDPIQHKAMRLEHPAVFRPLASSQFDSEWGGTVFSYTGEAFEIARLLEVVRDWHRRPATEEQLRDILGATDGT